MSILVGDIINTVTSGSLKVLERVSGARYLCEFPSTGYRVEADQSNMLRGNVKDRMLRTRYGVGYIGGSRFNRGNARNAYQCWSGMLERCYCKKFKAKRTTYSGCSVCSEWHNFQNFAKWYLLNYKPGLELDKDVLIDGNKLYSPSTCLFVTSKENSVKASAISFSIVSPDGEVVSGYNVKEFSVQNGLSRRCVSNVLNGVQKSHKGWTKA